MEVYIDTIRGQIQWQLNRAIKLYASVALIVQQGCSDNVYPFGKVESELLTAIVR